MSRELRVEIEAVEELHEAARWYEDHRPGLGVEFVEAVERTVARVLQLPQSFPRVLERPHVQRALVKRFPYAVVFTVRAEVIHVIVYAHAKRRPLYWAHRVGEEDE